jgi:hypothetical protein
MSANSKTFNTSDYTHAVFHIPQNIDLSWNYVGPGDFYLGGIDQLLERVRGNIQNDTDVVVLWGAPSRLHLYPECVDRINQFTKSIPNLVVLFNGNYSTNDTSALQCRYSEFAYFEHIARSTWSRCDIAAPRTKQFTMIGTKDYPTRKYLLSRIVEHGLDSQAYISYKQINTGDIAVGNYSQEEIDHITDVANRVDSRLPWPALDNSIEFPQLPRHLLLDSYVNMVTDTYFEGDIFVSEKVYTAIAHGQMFVMLAPAGTLAYLRSRGYQTFGDHIDESYDQIENNFQRLQAVTQVLITLAKSDLADLYARCRHIVQHNHHLFYTRDTQAEFVAKIQHFSG